MDFRGAQYFAVACAVVSLSTGTMAVAATGSATAPLSVTATVTSNCTISTTALAFGNYDAVVTNASTNLDATGTVVVACTKGAAATIGLNAGSNASGSTRRMTNGSDFLTYEVYKETGRTNVWGNASTGLYDAGTATSSAAQTLTVYGRVASGQTGAAVGSYTDTLTATVNF